MSIQEKVARFHDKHYKHLLIIPIAVLLLSVGYIWYFYSVNHDFIHKDISLTGGTTVTLYENLNPDTLKNNLSDKLANLNVRTIYDLITQEQKAVVLETTTDIDTTKQILEQYLGYQLDDSNSSFEFTGSSLGQSFYLQLLIAILIAFVFMAIVVFILFRSFVPSAAVIISAFADITMTLFVVDVFGMTLSSAGIIAFLMLIGYSVDTDILLTTRLIKRDEGSVNKRLFEAFKTGVTMTLTSIAAVGCALLIVRSFSSVLSQIFTILLIGLFFDIFNTWLTNASILKWYVNRKK